MPLLYLPLILIKTGSSTALLKDWVFTIWIKSTGLSIIFGIFLGFAANRLLRNSQFNDLIDKQSFLAFSLELSVKKNTTIAIVIIIFIQLLIMTVMNLMRCNEMLAIFVAGAVFAWDDWFIDQTKESQLQPVVDSIFNSTFFVMFGVALPWAHFKKFGLWKLFANTLLILLLRRLPVVWFFGPLKEKRERLFAGWFGPIGVGAIFYAICLANDLNDHEERFIPLTCFIVMSSVLAHGITVPLFHLTITRQLTLDMIRIDYWKTMDLALPEIEIEKEEITADLISRK